MERSETLGEAKQRLAIEAEAVLAKTRADIAETLDTSISSARNPVRRVVLRAFRQLIFVWA